MEEADGQRWGDGGWLIGEDVAVRRLPLPTTATASGSRGAADSEPLARGAGAAAPGRRSLHMVEVPAVGGGDAAALPPDLFGAAFAALSDDSLCFLLSARAVARDILPNRSLPAAKAALLGRFFVLLPSKKQVP